MHQKKSGKVIPDISLIITNYNYEQFLMYTMSLEYFYPLSFDKLGIDEKDIFLRFAINRGKDEFLDYAFAKIFWNLV